MSNFACLLNTCYQWSNRCMSTNALRANQWLVSSFLYFNVLKLFPGIYQLLFAFVVKLESEGIAHYVSLLNRSYNLQLVLHK